MTMIRNVFNSLEFRGLYRLGSYQPLGVSGWAKVALKVSLVCGVIGLVALALKARSIRIHNAKEFNRIIDEHAKNPPGPNNGTIDEDAKNRPPPDIRISDGKETLAVIEYVSSADKEKLNALLTKYNAQWKKNNKTKQQNKNQNKNVM